MDVFENVVMCDNIYKRSYSVGNQSFWLRTHFRYRQQFYWHSTRAIEIDITGSCVSIHAHSQRCGCNSLSLSLSLSIYLSIYLSSVTVLPTVSPILSHAKMIERSTKMKFSFIIQFCLQTKTQGKKRKKNKKKTLILAFLSYICDVWKSKNAEKHREWGKARLKRRMGDRKQKWKSFW